MSEVLSPSLQYDDLRGKIAIDGWEHVGVSSMGIGWRRGYWPVGIAIYGGPDKKGADLAATIDVLCVDESILDGKGPDAVRRYALQNGQLPVFRFSRKATVSDLIPLIKRVSIILQESATEGVPLVMAGGDKIYDSDELDARDHDEDVGDE